MPDDSQPTDTRAADTELAALAAKGERQKANEASAKDARSTAARLYRGYLDVDHWPRAPQARLPVWRRLWGWMSKAAGSAAEVSLGETINIGSDEAVIALCKTLPDSAHARRANQRRAAEAQWVASLPFAMSGYLDVLSDKAQYKSTLIVVLAWTGRPPQQGLLQSAIYAHDAEAAITSQDDSTTTVRSSEISGETGWKVNLDGEMFLHTNGRIVTYIHGLADKVLVPLHQTHAIREVLVSRGA
jgi:hypothetical protein